MKEANRRVVVGVGAVIWNAQSEVLLIRRANPPRRHEWSLPGGKVEFGESLRTAILREVREETGLQAEILGLIDVAELILEESEAGSDMHYVLVDFSARASSGEPVVATDAIEARWFTLEEVPKLLIWEETRRIIDMSAASLNVPISR